MDVHRSGPEGIAGRSADHFRAAENERSPYAQALADTGVSSRATQPRHADGRARAHQHTRAAINAFQSLPGTTTWDFCTWFCTLLMSLDIREPDLGRRWKKGLEAGASNPLILFTISGRDGGIRTRDPLHPMQVRYQAALRPDDQARIIEGRSP